MNIKLDGVGDGNLAQMIQALNYAQVGQLIFSTSTNVLSTGLIGTYFWFVAIVLLDA